MTSQSSIISLLKTGSHDCFGENNFFSELKEERPLRIKVGIDPTGPDLHLGHVILLNKLKQLQALGHHIIFLVGDFTALIGDPSEKNITRPMLTEQEVRENAKTYQQQFNKILDPTKTELCFNSHWLSQLSADKLIKLASMHTVARMLERKDFQKRYQQHQSIRIHEFLYPLLQAYDSVVLKADIEMGGTDQTFNLLLGRELQQQMGLTPQIVVTFPMLEGLDGTQKMSKSLNNYISLQEVPFQIFSKLMSISDTLMWRYYRLLSLNDSLSDIEKMEQQVEQGQLNPRDCKMRLALELTQRFHNEKTAIEAKNAFIAQFQQKQLPSNIPTIIVTTSQSTLPLTNLLKEAGLTKSTSEAMRLLKGGAIRVENEKIIETNVSVSVNTTQLYQVGKKRYAKICLKQQ